ncbi:MAG TPA: pyrimidine 5'-nucleotidase [Anaerolineales bacterium]|nr:pyrimidine 5'-nucleotidase [Anaerolineales bacterium]
MRFSTLFFDLDDTLYPNSSGLWQAIKARINLYMVERLGIAEKDAPALRESYFKMYGTTLRGLQARHNVDTEDFLAFVHDLTLKEYIKPDPIQREIIASLSSRKLIFTNADANHARRVLAALDLDDLFEKIVDIHTVAPYCKPMPESFAIAQEFADEPDPRKCVVIDDLPRTTRAALEAGMASILYGTEEPTAEASGVFTDWSHLPILLG